MHRSGDGPSEATAHREPRAARVAVALVFAVNGMALANWFPRIPAVQRDLGLSEGALGIALLGPAIGALLAMLATGMLIARFGSRPVTRTAVLALCACLPLPALAPNLWLLTLALMAVGAGNGVLDVAMNAQAIAVERRYERPIMSTFHALFSAGGLAGAAIAGVVASRGVGPAPHLLVVAGLLGVVALVASQWLLPAHVDARAAGPAFVPLTRPLVALGVLGFCVLLGEGAMADWTAVYLRNTLGAGAGLAAVGFAVFSATMAAGRFLGDWLTQRLGPVRLVRLGGAVAAIGLGVALLVGWPGAAVVGVACVGAGLSCVFPVVLSAAGRTSRIAPGQALAAVSTAGYTGFLVGPPVIGFAAEVIGLRGALGLVVLLSAAMIPLAGSVGRTGAAPARDGLGDGLSGDS